MKQTADQLDLFVSQEFPVRIASERIDLDRFRAQLKRAMAQAIRECPFQRPVIAARMAQYLGLPSLSKAMLDAYTAESKTGHDITMVRFKAFVKATGAVWLWDLIVSDEGLTLLDGDEIKLARIGQLRQQRRKIDSELRNLVSEPVIIKPRRRV